ncbi:MFS transporter [Phytohabitans aurantiacus]|uniref:Major facilitator superfamily (MFS) profile domain-containing protein n=1 Tax=Phytohabitans aurantiacus TaxID=3016789 RepID=A0ABQ5QRR1_9ACTN|nr:MFS transporter [Phytohabitans aurantiacus]GLH96556.1 hypothetical protein Pa4123_18300 [Phytohabitans aurantiacus]
MVPVLYLALLAAPLALSANSTTTVIPDLAGDLGLSITDATWTATAFGWATVLGAPLATGLIRRYGMRFAVYAHAVLVMAGTVLVVAAPALPVLLAGRAAQAAGGGGLALVAMALAGTARRTGVVTASIGLLGAFGPLAGSTLGAASWRLPLCLSLVALPAIPLVIRRLPPRDRDTAPTTTDVTGIALVMTLVSALVLIARLRVPALIAAMVAAVLLAAHIRRRPDGFVPTAVLRSAVFRTAVATAFTLSTSYFLVLYTVPRLLEEHRSPGWIGTMTLAALAAGSLTSMLFATRTARLGPTVTRTVLLATGATALVLTVTAPGPAAEVAATGFAVFATTAALAWYAARVGRAAPEGHRTGALGLLTLCYQLGGAFGPALATVLIRTT